MAKVKLANKKQIIEILGFYLMIDGILSIYFLNLFPNTGINFAFLIRFIRTLVGVYLLWQKK